MLTAARKKTILSVLALLLLFMSVSAPIAAFLHWDKVRSAVTIETACSQQKTAQMHAQKLCQGYNHLNFFSVLPELLLALSSLAEKMNLLFILGLLLMSPIYVIFKPPKSRFVF